MRPPANPCTDRHSPLPRTWLGARVWGGMEREELPLTPIKVNV